LERETMHSKRQTAEVVGIFERIEETIEMAEHGLAGWCGDDNDLRIPGLKNFLVYARAITNVVQNLRNKVEGFDAWYCDVEARMRSDDRMRYLYKLRTEILKAGATPVAFSIEPRPPWRNVRMDSRDLETPPFPGAQWLLKADGASWEGISETGEPFKVWSKVPHQWGLYWQTFGDLPGLPVPEKLRRVSITETCEAHLQALCAIVDEAIERFYPNGSAGSGD
jgi:hypothetical protein